MATRFIIVIIVICHKTVHIRGWKAMHPGKIVPKLFIYLFVYLFMWMTSFLNNLNSHSYFSLK